MPQPDRFIVTIPLRFAVEVDADSDRSPTETVLGELETEFNDVLDRWNNAANYGEGSAAGVTLAEWNEFRASDGYPAEEYEA